MEIGIKVFIIMWSGLTMLMAITVLILLFYQMMIFIISILFPKLVSDKTIEKANRLDKIMKLLIKIAVICVTLGSVGSMAIIILRLENII